MNKKTSCIIVDDELNARLSLRGILEEDFPHVEILAEAKDLPEAVKAILKHTPEIVFLDIEMPGFSGLSILDFFEKDEINFKIVFVTAYSEYAINAFELSATDYLLKPIRQSHLERALKKLEEGKPVDYNILRNNLEPDSRKKIAISTNDGISLINLDEILYIKAEGSYSDIFLTENRKIFTSKRLIDFEKLEQMGPFLRIHRSHIVNATHIHKITKQDRSTIILSNGDELSVAQDKKNALLNMMNLESF